MIDQVTISDASRAIAFADDMRAVYNQVSEMQSKINRYIAGLQAIALGSVDAREQKFVELVQAIVSVEDLSRYDSSANKLLGTRRTGWSAWTGTATRSSKATSTATTADVAQALKALIDDLSTHGIIGG